MGNLNKVVVPLIVIWITRFVFIQLDIISYIQIITRDFELNEYNYGHKIIWILGTPIVDGLDGRFRTQQKIYLYGNMIFNKRAASFYCSLTVNCALTHEASKLIL